MFRNFWEMFRRIKNEFVVEWRHKETISRSYRKHHRLIFILLKMIKTFLIDTISLCRIEREGRSELFPPIIFVHSMLSDTKKKN